MRGDNHKLSLALRETFDEGLELGRAQGRAEALQEVSTRQTLYFLLGGVVMLVLVAVDLWLERGAS